MKIHVLSDLHLEFALFDPPETDADVVILAGDISTGLQGLKWALQTFTQIPVIYVCGNHEYYGKAIPKLTDDLRALAEETNIHVLENESVEINEVIFKGCTLWTDFRLFNNPVPAMMEAQEQMTDYRRIRVSPRYRRLAPFQTAAWHAASCRWLNTTTESDNGHKTVIVTHHAPSSRSIPMEFASQLVSGAYASNLEDLVTTSGASLWVHGHIHASLDYLIGETRIVCNARGYPDEPVRNFDPGLVVTI